MDWRHVLFAAEQGIPELIGLTVILPAFALAATPNGKLKASAASLSTFFAFTASCLLAGIPDIESSQLARYFPGAGLVVTVALVAPSVLALRWRWVGVLHLLTVAAAAYLWFVGSLAISHDAT